MAGLLCGCFGSKERPEMKPFFISKFADLVDLFLYSYEAQTKNYSRKEKVFVFLSDFQVY